MKCLLHSCCDTGIYCGMYTVRHTAFTYTFHLKMGLYLLSWMVCLLPYLINVKNRKVIYSTFLFLIHKCLYNWLISLYVVFRFILAFLEHTEVLWGQVGRDSVRVPKLHIIIITIITKNYHGIFIIKSMPLALKSFTWWQRPAYACAIQVYQSLGVLIIIL